MASEDGRGETGYIDELFRVGERDRDSKVKAVATAGIVPAVATDGKLPQVAQPVLVNVPFHGDHIEAIEKDGKVRVPLRHYCHVLGIDHDSQRKKLKGRSWACAVIITVQVGGQGREMYCIDEASLPMWLGLIHEKKVSEVARPWLIRYQREAAQVLRDHFAGKEGRLLPERVKQLGESAYSKGVVDTMQMSSSQHRKDLKQVKRPDVVAMENKEERALHVISVALTDIAAGERGGRSCGRQTMN